MIWNFFKHKMFHSFEVDRRLRHLMSKYIVANCGCNKIMLTFCTGTVSFTLWLHTFWKMPNFAINRTLFHLTCYFKTPKYQLRTKHIFQFVNFFYTGIPILYLQWYLLPRERKCIRKQNKPCLQMVSECFEGVTKPSKNMLDK